MRCCFTPVTFLPSPLAPAQVVFAADRSYRAGQEICTSYGDMDNAKRLFSFGFVTLRQPARHSQSRLVDTLPLPTEAFCDISFDSAPSDALCCFKKAVLREHGLTRDGTPLLSAMFPLTPCRPFVRQLVGGPARSFVDDIMPILRLVALTFEEFAGEEDFEDVCKLSRGDLAPADLDASPILAAGRGIRVLKRLGRRFSDENERVALGLLRERCSDRLQAVHPSLRDVEALREGARESSEAETFSASAPLSLLCATVRVGEAIAWHALLEVCNSRRAEGCASQRTGETWASWVLSIAKLQGKASFVE